MVIVIPDMLRVGFGEYLIMREINVMKKNQDLWANVKIKIKSLAYMKKTKKKEGPNLSSLAWRHRIVLSSSSAPTGRSPDPNKLFPHPVINPNRDPLKTKTNPTLSPSG